MGRKNKKDIVSHKSTTSSQATPPPLDFPVSRRRWILWSLIVILPMLTLLHYSDGVVRERQMINYDDLDLIKPMLKGSLGEYFTLWLPDRNNHAYPLRDMTYFLDQWVSEKIGIPFYWMTHILMLVIVTGLFAFMASYLVRGPPGLLVVLTAIMAIHPLNIEVVQWLMIRKHLMTMMIIWLGSALVLYRLWQNRPLSKKDWGICWVTYLAGLLCFPTGLLWMPWVIWTQIKFQKFSIRERFPIIFVTIFVIGNYYALTTTGEADYSNSLMGLLMGKTLIKGLLNAVMSAGRGFWNLIAPFQLATFYSEQSPLIGWGLVTLIIFVYWVNKTVRAPEDRGIIYSLVVLGLVILAPSALVFIGFPEYVWADRYDFTILPNFLLIAGIAARQLPWQKNKFILASTIGLALWGLLATKVTVERVPLWRDAVPLMRECADHEKSAKCIIQTIQRTLHKGGCGPMKPVIEAGRNLYKDRPKYNFEFQNEMPFYDALCVALSTQMSPAEKVEKIPYFWDIYEGSAEVMFSLVLAHLENGDLKSAWSSASSYYLKGDPLALPVTRNTLNIYRGHTKALCEIFKTQICYDRMNVLLQANQNVLDDPGYRNWGYNVTKTMFERSLEKKSP